MSSTSQRTIYLYNSLFAVLRLGVCESLTLTWEVFAARISTKAFTKIHTSAIITVERDDALSHARSPSSPDGTTVSAGNGAYTCGVRSEGGRRRRRVEGAAEASEAKEMRMENTVSGDRWWCGNERSVEGRRLTCLPVAGSVGVRQVENPSVASLALLNWRNRVRASRSRVFVPFLLSSKKTNVSPGKTGENFRREDSVSSPLTY